MKIHEENSMIELGGNIFLEGFEILDQSELLIIKKLIGSYVRKMSEQTDCSNTKFSLEKKEDGFLVTIGAFSADNALLQEASIAHSNVFFAIDLTLKELSKKLEI